MKLSNRVMISTLAITLIFTALIILLIFQYSSNVAVVTQYNDQTQPAREAIEHLLTTIYDDFLLVEQYLLINDYSELLEYDKKLSHSAEQCEALTDEVDDLIKFDYLTDEQAVDSYKTAVLVYSSWERSRDSLLEQHKELVVNRKYTSLKSEKERFIVLMQNSSTHFAASLEQLNAQHARLQQDLAIKTKTMKLLFIALLLTFLIASIISSYLLIVKLTKPLDHMSRASVEFTKGNYSTRVEENSSVAEINSLQQQLNRVYSLVESTFKTTNEKTKAAKHLLPPQYKEILDHIKDSSIKGCALTIKDIKKHFSLTHPTVISRLRYLEQNGYIEIRKQGRNKCIFET